MTRKTILFAPFRLEPTEGRLWRGTAVVELTPKAFAVLQHLAERHGRLVTKEELLEALWPETHVGEAVLKVCVREIRRALGDETKAPQFIETLHRRGYRFIGELSGSDSPRSVEREVPLPGREDTLRRLQGRWEGALSGERQVVFIAGEAGLGKSTLIDSFLKRISTNRNGIIARSRCLELQRGGEPYQPVLEAFGRLCREPGGERLTAVLERFAPSWIVQMPSLLTTERRQALGREFTGAPSSRMLREMAEAVEALTAERPMVLVLEDLQWSDRSTLDLIATLSRPGSAARLLIVVTYRPSDAARSDHPLRILRQELQFHRGFEEWRLELLSQDAVAEYLEARFSPHSFPAALSGLIHAHTDGNPLFVVDVVDQLVEGGVIQQEENGWRLKTPAEEVEIGVPERLRQLIEQQVGRLSDEERHLLEAASAAGTRFSSALLSSEINSRRADELCEGLVRRGLFLRSDGVVDYPDSTACAGYAFQMVVHQQVIYDSMAVSQRLRLHHQIGERLEQLWGGRVGEIAAELEQHFRLAHDHARAALYGQTNQAVRTQPLMAIPEIRYARSGDVNIAYQVLGDGPLDLVFVMGWVSHLEYFWQEPHFARFLRRLASFSRLILFDKRGTGLSDRVPLSKLPTLEERMDDVRAVLDAVGSEGAALCGVSEGGPMSALFAATYPEKTEALVMLGTYAKRTRDAEYPWGPTPEEREEFCRLLERGWGGPIGIEDRAPSLATDSQFREWWATYLRMGASPGAAVALTRMNADIDVRQVLPSIRVPTLVMHRTGDQCLTVEEGRYVASQIVGARFVELPGNDHLPFAGDQDQMLDEIETFLRTVHSRLEANRVLATVLVVKAHGVTRERQAWKEMLHREVAWFRGRLWSDGDEVLATFDGPARAVRCATAIVSDASRFGFKAGAAVHTGECDYREQSVGGLAVRMAQQMLACALPDEVLASRTVRDLVAGSGIQFTPRSVLTSLDVPGEWPLFEVERPEARSQVNLR